MRRSGRSYGCARKNQCHVAKAMALSTASNVADVGTMSSAASFVTRSGWSMAIR
jgi:hypothetical protein